MAGIRQQGSEHLGFVKGGKFLKQLSYYQRVRKILYYEVSRLIFGPLKREKYQLIIWHLLGILFCACFKFDLSYSH